MCMACTLHSILPRYRSARFVYDAILLCQSSELKQYAYSNHFPVQSIVAFFVGDMTPAECKAQWYEMNGNKVKWTEKEDVVSEIK